MTIEQSKDKDASGAAPDAGTEQANTPAVENNGTADGAGENTASGQTDAGHQEGGAASESAPGDSAPETAAADQTPPESTGAPEPAAETAADPKPKPVFAAPGKKTGAGASGSTQQQGGQVKTVVQQPAAKQQSTVSAGAGVEAMAEKTGPTGLADVDRLIKDVPAVHCTALMQIVQYTKDMAPRRPISETDGARHQSGLYRSLQTIINTEDQYFHPLFTALLKLIQIHEPGVFHETYIFRFMENMALPTEDRRGFVKIITMLKMLGDPKSRKTIAAQIGWAETLRYGLNEAGRQRILSYFEV